MSEIDCRLLQDTEFSTWLQENETLARLDCTPGKVYRYPISDGVLTLFAASCVEGD